MDMEEIQYLLGSAIFARAKKYVKCIESYECKTEENGVRHLSAEVEGSGDNLYETEAWLRQNGSFVSASCTCPYNDNGNGLFCKHIGALLLYDQKETAQMQKSCPSKIGLTAIPGVVRGTANLPEESEPVRKDSYASGLQMLFGRKWRGDEPESDPEARALLRTYREGELSEVEDINESMRTFSSNKAGDVRFGLGAVKGVGEAAVESIIAERNANGRFKDIYDLMERVNFSAVNRKCFENLAYAGGFDSISGFHRGKFFGADARDNTGVTFIEQLMRYGQRFQAEKNNAQQSLFGGGGHVDIQRPVLPACADWSQLETLAKEREMIGHYLSAHPLDDYKIIINHMCKTQLTELENLEALKGQEIAVAGMVVSVQNLITKTGKPWGKFVLEDYNGTHEFALFSKDYENFRKYLFSDYFLFVRGRVQPKPYNDKELEFKIISMVQLSEMRDTMIKEMNVLLPVEDVTPTLVRELTEKVKEAKGETLFRISVIDREAHVSLSLFSKSHKVSLTQSLVSYLDDNEIKYSIA